MLCLHFLLPSITSCYKPFPAPCCCGCIPGTGGLHPPSQVKESTALLYCAALASAPCWLGAQDQSSCSWGRNQGGKNVWKEWEWGVAPHCLAWLAAWCVYCLPCTGERRETALCGLRLMDTPPFLPEIWRGWGSWLSLPAEVTGIGSNQWENPGFLSCAMLWYLTRSSSLDNVIPYLGDGEQLTWGSEPILSGEGGHCGFQEGLCPFTLVLSLPTAG